MRTVPLTLIDAFSNAAVRGGGWESALAQLASETRSSLAQIIGIGGPRSVPFNIVDMDEASKAQFVEIEGGSPQVNYRVAASVAARPLQVVRESDYAVARTELRTDVYNDFVRDHDIPHGCQTVLAQEPELLIGLATLRSSRDGLSSPEDVATFEAIAPHVRAAVLTQLALGHQGDDLVCGAMEAIDAAAFICDGAGRVRAMTPRAEALVSDGRVLKMSAGRLRAATDREDALLRRAVLRALEGRHNSGAPAQTVFSLRGDHAQGQPMVMQADSLPALTWGFDFLPRVLLVVRSASVRAPDVEMLCGLWGLTDSEAQVALLMARGLDREQIAKARGSSLATVRSQIKAAFRKTGAGREAELAVLVRGLG